MEIEAAMMLDNDETIEVSVDGVVELIDKIHVLTL
jgi:hypothetical protein